MPIKLTKSKNNSKPLKKENWLFLCNPRIMKPIKTNKNLKPDRTTKENSFGE
jgi:hypothetical protein